MKRKLIKSDIQYRLHNEEGIVIATSLENGKLSIKNCEAIANGYDLDELGTEAYKKHNIDNLSLHEEIQRSGAFLVGHKEGFQKALEILGDKKFSEEDMRKGFEAGYETLASDKTYNEHYDKLIQSLRQTEFDVEIAYEKDCYSSAGRCDKLIMADCIICTPVTYLRDENGCLILKRI